MRKINKKNSLWRYSFAAVVLIVGLVLSYFNVGGEFLGFYSVGSWLIYVGFLMLVVMTLQLLFNKKRVVDERMEFVVTKASRVTFIGIILFAFVVMVIDGIKPIEVAYSYFMSYFICGMVLLYMISYKILIRFY